MWLQSFVQGCFYALMSMRESIRTGCPGRFSPACTCIAVSPCFPRCQMFAETIFRVQIGIRKFVPTADFMAMASY